MSQLIPVINAFIEDTCVLMVIAYLLARGRTLQLLFSERRSLQSDVFLGLVLGLIGTTEVIFPGARAPYVTHTLIITFATLVGGLRVGSIAALVVVAGAAFALHSTPGVTETMLTLAAGVVLSEIVRRVFGRRHSLLRGLIAGMGVQASVVLLHRLPIGILYAPHILSRVMVGIPANGFGLVILQLILTDARKVAESEQNRLEAERAHALVWEAQLIALRARVHPHFLFNTLNSIAALCGIAPDRAESAILRLSQLMRHALLSDPAAPLSLPQELEYVRGYLEIEQNRLGPKLKIEWVGDEFTEHTVVPAFAIQTLVENAILHGIAPKGERGTVKIEIRRRARYTLIAVVDDGLGMTDAARSQILTRNDRREHGLQITAQQLTLLHGRFARLRIFSGPGRGTMAVFAVPNRNSIR